MAKKIINSTKQIDHAEVVQTGWGGKTVRMKHDGKEIGFATTTYSHHQTDEVKEYSAERISLLMQWAHGVSNDAIRAQLNQRKVNNL